MWRRLTAIFRWLRRQFVQFNLVFSWGTLHVNFQT